MLQVTTKFYQYIKKHKAISVALSIVTIVLIATVVISNNSKANRTVAGIIGVPTEVTLIRESGQISYRHHTMQVYESVLESRRTIRRNSHIKSTDGVGYVFFDTFSYHKINPNTELQIEDIEVGTYIIQKAGEILHSFNSRNSTPSKQYMIDTPDVRATVRGTTLKIQVVQENNTTITRIYVLEGIVEVYVLSLDKTITLTAGQMLEVDSGRIEQKEFVIESQFSSDEIDFVSRIRQTNYSLNSKMEEFITTKHTTSQQQSSSTDSTLPTPEVSLPPSLVLQGITRQQTGSSPNIKTIITEPSIEVSDELLSPNFLEESDLLYLEPVHNSTLETPLPSIDCDVSWDSSCYDSYYPDNDCDYNDNSGRGLGNC